MKSFAPALALFASASALQLQYDIGDAPKLSAEAQAFDPEKMSNYDALTGRGDTQEGPGTNENVLFYETGENGEVLTVDQQNRPMCHTGGIDEEPDTEGPSPECCRVYEYENFVGRHYDFCLYDVDNHDCPHEKYWQADTYGWHNEITSYWCGDKVGIRLCAHDDDASATTDKAALGECRGGNANVIEDHGKHATMTAAGVVDKSDSIWITKVEGCAPAVIYEDPQCEGPSWFAHFDIRQQKNQLGVPAYGTGWTKFEGSWDYYDGAANHDVSKEGNMQLRFGSSESVKLAPHIEFETFFTVMDTTNKPAPYYDTTFGRENAFTLRNLKDLDYLPFVDTRMNQCHEYLGVFNSRNANRRQTPYDVHNLQASMTAAGKWPPTDSIGNLITGLSHAYAIKVREMYFPPLV